MRRPAARKSIALLLVLFSLLTSVPVSAQQSEADVFVAQAILAYEDKHYDEALAHLREALAQDPKNVEALYYTGLVYIAQQRRIQETRRTIAKHPGVDELAELLTVSLGVR